MSNLDRCFLVLTLKETEEKVAIDFKEIVGFQDNEVFLKTSNGLHAMKVTETFHEISSKIRQASKEISDHDN